MALFGKKKRAEPSAPAEQETIELTDETEDEGASDEAFDFDAISRDLEASDGPSPFDDLLANPVSDGDASGQTETYDLESANDDGAGFSVDAQTPDSFNTEVYADPNDNAAPAQADADLDFSSNFDGGGATETASFGGFDDDFSGAAQAGANADGISIEPIAPQAMPLAPMNDASSVAPLYRAPILSTDLAPGAKGGGAAKRGLPLPMILGALALLLALGGAGWWVMNQNAQTEDEAAPIAARAPDLQAPADPTGETAVAANTNAAAPGVPPVGEAPADTKVVRLAPGQPAPGQPAQPLAPADKPSPAVMAKLKALWNKGAAAKKRQDYAGARAAWQEALRIQPGHPGFQDSIDKLPPA